MISVFTLADLMFTTATVSIACGILTLGLWLKPTRLVAIDTRRLAFGQLAIPGLIGCAIGGNIWYFFRLPRQRLMPFLTLGFAAAVPFVPLVGLYVIGALLEFCLATTTVLLSRLLEPFLRQFRYRRLLV